MDKNWFRTSHVEDYIVPHMGVQVVNRSSQVLFMISYTIFVLLLEVRQFLMGQSDQQLMENVLTDTILVTRSTVQRMDPLSQGRLILLCLCALLCTVSVVQWRLKKKLDERVQNARSVFPTRRSRDTVQQYPSGTDIAAVPRYISKTRKLFDFLNLLFTLIALAHLALHYVVNDSDAIPLTIVLALPFLAMLHVGIIQPLFMSLCFTLLAMISWAIVIWIGPLFCILNSLLSATVGHVMDMHLWETWKLLLGRAQWISGQNETRFREVNTAIMALVPLYIFYVLKNVLSMHVRTWISSNEINLWHHMVLLDTLLERMPCAIWQEQMTNEGEISFAGFRGSLFDGPSAPRSRTTFMQCRGMLPSKEQMDKFIAAGKHVLRTGRNCTGILDFVDQQDGESIMHVSYVLCPLGLPNRPSVIDSVIGVGVDVTDIVQAQAQLKKQEHEYRQLIHNISDVIMRLDNNFTIEFINTRTFLDRPSEYYIGRSFLELDFCHMKCGVEELLKKTLSSDVSFENHRAYFKFDWAYNIQARHCVNVGILDSEMVRSSLLEGDIVFMSTTASPIIEWSEETDINANGYREVSSSGPDAGNVRKMKLGHGEIVGIILSTRDITERKRSIELEKMSREARFSSKSKSEFISQMSHEIRNPLHAIIGTLDLLVHSEELSLAQFEYIDDCRQSAHLLLDILGDILDVERIAQGKFSISEKRHNLIDVVEGVVEMQTANARARGIELLSFIDPRIDITLMFDRIRLNQILTNLLSNGVKFTAQGYVCVSANMVEEYSDSYLIRFDCEDTGIGIKEENKSKVFKPFEQVAGDQKNHFGGGFDRGFGLGLDIVSKLVHAMNGSVEIRSKYGEGSTFSVFLTLRKVMASSGTSSSSGENTTSKTIHTRPLGKQKIKDQLPRSVFSKAVLVGCSERMRRILDQYLSALRVHYIQSRDMPTTMNGEHHTIANGRLLKRDLVDTCLTSPPQSTAIIINCKTRRDVEMAIYVAHNIRQHCKVIILLPLEIRSAHISGEEQGVLSLRRPVRLARLAKSLRTAGDTPPTPMSPALRYSAKEQEKFEHPRKGVHLSILIAEDNPVNLRIMCSFLKTLGCDRIKSALNGKEVVDHIQRGEPGEYDLILMDLSMPIMDGFEAAHLIRNMRDPQKRNIPIVAVTGNSDAETADQCRRLGFNEVLVKPCTMNDVRQVLLDSLQHSSRA